MSSAASRMRSYRERIAQGRIAITVEVDEVALVEALKEASLLPPYLAEDRDAIQSAVERLIEYFILREGESL